MIRDTPDLFPLEGKEQEFSSFLSLSPNYSDVYIHDTKQGYYILLLHNVCFDFNTNGMNIYVKDEKDIDLSAIPKGILGSLLLCSVSIWMEF